MLNNTMFMAELNKYYAVWQEYNYVYEEWAKAHQLSVNSLLVLSALYEGGANCTQKQISQRWLIPKQTINMVLKDFVRKGLVELHPCQEDKRNKLISLTEQGRAYAAEIIGQLRQVELFVIEKMGLAQIQHLNESLALFVELFRQAGGI